MITLYNPYYSDLSTGMLTNHIVSALSEASYAFFSVCPIVPRELPSYQGPLDASNSMLQLLRVVRWGIFYENCSKYTEGDVEKGRGRNG